MDKPMVAGETEPRAARARMADSQLEPQNQEILRRKSFSLPPFAPVFWRNLEHPYISEDTSI